MEKNAEKLDANKFPWPLVFLLLGCKDFFFETRIVFNVRTRGEKECHPNSERDTRPFFRCPPLLSSLSTMEQDDKQQKHGFLFLTFLTYAPEVPFSSVPNRESGRCMCFKILLAWMIVEKGEREQRDRSSYFNFTQFKFLSYMVTIPGPFRALGGIRKGVLARFHISIG